MVCTDLVSDRLLGLAHLAGQLHLQPLGRQLDRRQRVLDLVRQPPRHLAPGLGALRRHDLGDVVEHQQPRALPGDRGHFGAARHQRHGVLRRAGLRGVELERLLPVVQAVLLALVHVFVELLLHRVRRRPRAPRTLASGWPSYAASGTRRMRVAPGLDDWMLPFASSTITPAVRLSRMVCRLARARVHLPHALVHRRARVGQLLRHLGERSRQAAEFVLALQRGLGRQVAGRHLAHAGGQQQQRPRELVAQDDRPAARRRTPPGTGSASACRCTCGAGPRGPARAPGTRGWPPARRWRWPPASAAAPASPAGRAARPAGPGWAADTTASALMRALLTGVQAGLVQPFDHGQRPLRTARCAAAAASAARG